MSEADVRKFIRGRLIENEDYNALLKGLDAGLEIATQGINLAASGMSDDQLQDVVRQTGAYLNNFQKGGETIEGEIDGAALNKKLELATKFMTAGKNEQAVENFKAVLQMVKTAENFEGKGTTVAVFDSLIGVLDGKTKTTAQDIKKLASATSKAKKGAGSTGKAKSKSGNKKVMKIQEILNSINDNKIKVDGKWGPNTQKAYVSFVTRTGKKGWINLLKNKAQFTKVSRVKWPEAAKILSSNGVTTFKGNIDGMIKFLEYAAKEYNIGETPAEQNKTNRKAKASGKFVAFELDGQKYEIELDTDGDPYTIYKGKETKPLADPIEVADVEAEFAKQKKAKQKN